MKRTFAFIGGGLAAAIVFAGLVHTVLMAAHVSEPAATTVHGLTFRRLWATAAAGLGLLGVIIGGLALARPASRFGIGSARLGAIGSLVAGLLAVINGALVLALATGGPGSGNGVVGAAGALVLGLIGLALGGVALARSRRAGQPAIRLRDTMKQTPMKRTLGAIFAAILSGCLLNGCSDDAKTSAKSTDAKTTTETTQEGP